MADDVKMLIVERNGTELDYQEEHMYHADNQPFDPSGSPYTEVETGPAIKESISLSGVALSLLQTGYKGNASAGKWLQVFAGNPSNTSPLVVAQPAEIIAASFSNKKTATAAIGVYVNSVLVYTLNVATSQTEYGSVPTPVVVVPGDEISIKIISGTTRNPVFVVTMKGII